MAALHFIVNPQAKNGYSLKIWNELKRELQSTPHSIHFTESPKHATELVYEIARMTEGRAVITAVGGDGTVNEVINGAVGYEGMKVAYIPAGSGNDFARGYSLPNNPRASLKRILASLEEEGMELDAGSFHTSEYPKGHFVNSIGAGFDAQITVKANQSNLKKWLNKLSLGKLIYAFYLIKELLTYKPGPAVINIDGEEFHFPRMWFITVSNHPYYGGGMKISPAAKPDDGLFNITVLNGLPKWKLLTVFISVFWGGHIRFKEVKTFEGKNITIKSKSAIPVHADGEYIGKTPVHIEIRPKSWVIL
ncbi:diacylglycerol/lipid kinase family protein [Falsibacillus pallidus]|uniref:diacylglycerol/lipid kinase family protein n=1 Tax=Falsibacillus pallidus TaxID=493781 RepID=UPI003D97B5F8